MLVRCSNTCEPLALMNPEKKKKDQYLFMAILVGSVLHCMHPLKRRNSGKLRGGEFIILVMVWDPQGEDISRVTYKRNRFGKELQKKVQNVHLFYIPNQEQGPYALPSDRRQEPGLGVRHFLSLHPGPTNSQLWDCGQITQPLWVSRASDPDCLNLSSDSAKYKRVWLWTCYLCLDFFIY